MTEHTTEDYTKDKINIKVMGIGGGGCNAVTQMIKSGIKGVDFYVVNTEKGSLDRMDILQREEQDGRHFRSLEHRSGGLLYHQH